MKTTLKSFLLVLLALALMLSLCACTQSEKNSNQDITIGKTSIVSTAADISEILSGIDFGGNVVLADTYSFGVESIDSSVCTLDYLNPDIEAIAAMSPDIVFVSSSSTDGTTDPYATLKDLGINVVYIPTAQSIDDIKSNITAIAESVDAPEKAAELISRIDEAVEDISVKVAVLSSNAPKVYFELSAAPWLYSFGSGTFLNEIITICGGVNIYSNESGWLSNTEESVLSSNPDVILTTVQYDGYDYTEILSRAGWENIEAVKNSRVYPIDANASSRGTQNIVKAMYEILYALHPQYAQ